MITLRTAVTLLPLLVAGVAVSPAAGQSRPENAALRRAIVAAEQARAPSIADLQPLLDGVRHRSPIIQQLAVRALGRLERPALSEYIVPLLAAPPPIVRAEAANALGQAHQIATDSGAAVQALRERLPAERDALVRGVIYQTLGRLPNTTATDLQAVERLLVSGTGGEFNDPRGLARLGALIGLAALLPRQVKILPPAPATIERLRLLVREKSSGRHQRSSGETAVRIRRIALSALIAANGGDAVTLHAALSDPDAQVRRLAIVATRPVDAFNRIAGPGPGGSQLSSPARTALITAGLHDPQPMVRYEALQAFSATQAQTGCAPIVAASRKPGPRAAQFVTLLAIDLLGKECPAGERAAVTDRLVAVATQLRITRRDASAEGGPWHAPAHAIVSLAAVAPSQSAALLARFVSHPVWQVRMYAARAAATMSDDRTLAILAADADDNVRTAAIAGISRIQGHDADAVYINALQRTDHQLIRTAARALAGTPNQAPAIAALLSALQRLTLLKLDNTRDARLAILQTLKDLTAGDQASSLRPYLTDFDPAVASAAAELLTVWTGTPHRAAPVRPAATSAEYAVTQPSSSGARIVMKRGGVFALRLFADEAPATVARFVSLARAGYYNGLTFHRIAANFVIQGGSPGANEYAGDSPFMNDEVGLRQHRRGTVGISTRGRDTGDAQLFVNLVDNLRLDHTYTVWAAVTAGMAVVDGILEGDVIDRIVVQPVSTPAR